MTTHNPLANRLYTCGYMIFSSLQYLLFLPIAVLLYWRAKGFARLLLVVCVSHFFYMSWLPAYGILLFTLSAANWI